MINRKGTTVYNKGKKIKTFEEEEDAESFANALSMMENIKTSKVVEQKTNKLFTSINEFKQHLLSEGKEFEYMLLSRLKMDCKYFLGNGNGSERVLWADTVDEHIDKMKELWNGLEEKPEWLSFEDIEEYESKMKSMLQNNLNESMNEDEEDLYHDIDWKALELDMTQWFNRQPKKLDYDTFVKTFATMKEKILQYKMLN